MNTEQRNRPLSVPHLVFGIMFSGVAAVWFIGEATDADLPRNAIGFPIVLIGAGVIGLVATLVNARRRARSAYVAPTYASAPASDSAATGTDAPEETVVLDGSPLTHEEK